MTYRDYRTLKIMLLGPGELPRADFEINSNVDWLKAPTLIYTMAQSII